MFVEIRTRNMAVAPKIEARLREHVSVALTRFAPLIESVVVRLDDVNGPRGGIDKLCRTTVSLRHGGAIVAQGRNDSVPKALAASVTRARTQLREQRHKRARGSRRMAAERIAS